MLRRWTAYAADPDTPFPRRALVFLSLLLIPLIGGVGQALVTREVPDIRRAATQLLLGVLIAVSFAAVWHIMSRRNR